MDKVTKRIESLKKALQRLSEAIERKKKNHAAEDYAFFQDSVIKRFEFTNELFWKCLKELLESTGSAPELPSPKSIIKKSHTINLISDEELKDLLNMIEDRNEAAHTYNEDEAQIIADRIAHYFTTMSNITSRLFKI